MLEMTGSRGYAVLSVQEGETVAVGTAPVRCPDCGTMHYLWVNRAGVSRCVACDEQVVAGPRKTGGGLRRAV